MTADMTNASQAQRLVQQTIAHVGTIHVLVNNAGGVDGFAPFEEVSDEAWMNVLQLNFLSTVRLIRAVLPVMCRSPDRFFVPMSLPFYAFPNA